MTAGDGTDLDAEPVDRRAEWAARRSPSESDGVDRTERRAARAKRRRRRLGVLVTIGALLVSVFAVAGWFVWELDPPGGAGRPVIVEIKSGWGTKEAGDALQRGGVIGSSLAFQIWSKVSGGHVPGRRVCAARTSRRARRRRRARARPVADRRG